MQRRAQSIPAYSSTVKLQLQDVDWFCFLMSEAAAAGVSGDEWIGKTFDLDGRISCGWHLEILSKHLASFWLRWCVQLQGAFSCVQRSAGHAGLGARQKGR